MLTNVLRVGFELWTSITITRCPNYVLGTCLIKLKGTPLRMPWCVSRCVQTLDAFSTVRKEEIASCRPMRWLSVRLHNANTMSPYHLIAVCVDVDWQQSILAVIFYVSVCKPLLGQLLLPVLRYHLRKAQRFEGWWPSKASRSIANTVRKVWFECRKQFLWHLVSIVKGLCFSSRSLGRMTDWGLFTSWKKA